MRKIMQVEFSAQLTARTKCSLQVRWSHCDYCPLPSLGLGIPVLNLQCRQVSKFFVLSVLGALGEL